MSLIPGNRNLTGKPKTKTKKASPKKAPDKDSAAFTISVLKARKRCLDKMEYGHRVYELRLHLVQNWCLCKWCQMFSKDNPKFDHWFNELRECAYYIKSLYIVGLDMQKAAEFTLKHRCGYDESETVSERIKPKFHKEGINSWEERKKVASEFVRALNGLIDIISGVELNCDDALRKNIFGNMPK